MSGYFVVYAILAIWVFFDARKRKNNVIGWPGATVFAGPLVLPVYLAKRHLKEGEVREGGTGWNVLKNFALFWTLTMVFFGIVVVVAASSQADGASAALGATLGLGMLGFVWFSVLVAALVLGLFLKKASVVEKRSDRAFGRESGRNGHARGTAALPALVLSRARRCCPGGIHG